MAYFFCADKEYISSICFLKELFTIIHKLEAFKISITCNLFEHRIIFDNTIIPWKF